jgi:hypothetical protein
MSSCDEAPAEPAASPDAPAAGPSAFEAFFWPDTGAERSFSIRLEALIETCMTDRGFDYVSANPAATDPQAEATSTVDYGVVDTLINAAEGSTQEDPSAELWAYLETLGDVERAQYMRALWGDPADPASMTESCDRTANAEVAASVPRFQPQYQKILDDYYLRLKSDPRMVTAEQDWARCVEQSTGLAAATGAPAGLTRNNIELVVRADIAARLGATARWVTASEAEELDTSVLPQPALITVDESGIGVLTTGPVTRPDTATIEIARERERTIYSESERCWSETDGPAAIAALQADAMTKAEPLIASSDD